MPEIIAEVFRNDRIESVHNGHIVVVRPDGSLVAYLGDAHHKTYIRSAAKAFQLMPLLDCAAVSHFDFTEEELAVMMASHNGEDFHVVAVQSILEKIGLSNDHLKCGRHPPMYNLAAAQLLADGMEHSVLHNNCSGKHAGMLSLARFKDWPIASYLEFDHPVQRNIRERICIFSDLAAADIGLAVDGCSAPVFYLPIFNMALMYAKLAAGVLPAATEAFETMVKLPEMIAGTGRFDTQLMRVMVGKMASKVGAEGVRCLAIKGDEPLGIALKVSDGSKRASAAAMLEVLSQLGLIAPAELSQLERYAKPILKNHADLEVGIIKARFELN